MSEFTGVFVVPDALLRRSHSFLSMSFRHQVNPPSRWELLIIGVASSMNKAKLAISQKREIGEVSTKKCLHLPPASISAVSFR